MKLENLSLTDIGELIRLWKKHFGFFYDKRYEHCPEMLLDQIKDKGGWVITRYETRVGSKFTDDTKILVYDQGDNIEILAHMNDGNLERSIANLALAESVRERKKQELDAETAFNEDMKRYLSSR
jgi:hypothetical protein